MLISDCRSYIFSAPAVGTQKTQKTIKINQIKHNLDGAHREAAVQCGAIFKILKKSYRTSISM